MNDTYDIVIIGAGRAGLAAAEAAVQSGASRVLVIEHEPQSEKTAPAGVTPQMEFWWNSTAVGLLTGGGKRPHTVVARSANGTARARAPRIIVATGSYEVPREALRIPGTRPAGVMTPALALDLLGMGLLPGHRAVVYGSGSRAAAVVERLAQAGGEVVARVVPEEGAGSGQMGSAVSPVTLGRITRINGYPRLESVTVERPGGKTESIACDTLVVAVAVRPNVTLFKGMAIDVDTETHVVRVHADGLTSVEGIYAAGTCVRPDPEHRFSQEDGKRVGAAAVR